MRHTVDDGVDSMFTAVEPQVDALFAWAEQQLILHSCLRRARLLCGISLPSPETRHTHAAGRRYFVQISMLPQF